MGRLKVYSILGVCPYEQLDVPREFSPIDEVAKAILILSETPKDCIIFHPFNHHFVLHKRYFCGNVEVGIES